MKLLVLAVALFASIANAADIKIVSDRASGFEVGSIRVRNVVIDRVTMPDPNCRWPDGPICTDIVVSETKKQMVEVIVNFSDSTFPSNWEDNRGESVEFNLELNEFTAEELEAIKKVRGYKSIKLARAMFRAFSAKVKLPVKQPVYGRCDTEQNCEVIGHEEVLMTFTQLTIIRK